MPTTRQYEHNTIQFLFLVSQAYEALTKAEAKFENAKAFNNIMESNLKDKEYPSLVRVAYGINITDNQSLLLDANKMIVEMLELKVEHLFNRYRVLEKAMDTKIQEYSETQAPQTLMGAISSVFSKLDSKFFIKHPFNEDILSSNSESYFASPKTDYFYENVNHAFMNVGVDDFIKITLQGNQYLEDLEKFYIEKLALKYPSLSREMISKAFNFSYLPPSPNELGYIVRMIQNEGFKCQDMSSTFRGVNNERISFFNLSDERKNVPDSFMIRVVNMTNLRVNTDNAGIIVDKHFFSNFTDSLFDWSEEEIKQSYIIATDSQKHPSSELIAAGVFEGFILFMPSTGKTNIFSIHHNFMKAGGVMSYIRTGAVITQEVYSE